MRANFRLVLVLWCMGIAVACRAQSLREEAAARGLLIGTAARAYLFNERAYSYTLGREFNMVEAEDAMKWWALRPDQATFDFTQGDRVVAFAETHRMKVRGHNLVWGWTNPLWLTGGKFTPSQLAELLHEHIAKVATHYRGKVFAWDVLNEAFDDNGKVKSSIWYDQPGIGLAGQATAYIEQVFRWAHEADPEALLFYNDGDGEAVNAKSDGIYRMVKDFKERGVPIDGVGFQMHVFELHPDFAGIDANMTRFAGLGVQVHITEMDVPLPVDSYGNTSPEDLEKQAEIYRRITSICLSHANCTALETWGFSDKYSWIGSRTKKAKGAALLFDVAYAPKPAYASVLDALRKSPRNVRTAPLQ